MGKEINWDRLNRIFAKGEYVISVFESVGLEMVNYFEYIESSYPKHKILIQQHSHKLIIDDVIELHYKHREALNPCKSCKINGVECTNESITVLLEDKYVDVIEDILVDICRLLDMNLVMGYINNLATSEIDKIYNKHNKA